jgi:amidase
VGNLDELKLLDATAQAELVRRKEVRPIELVEAAIERIERINPSLNAVVTTMYDEARAAVTLKLPEGPFSGVPFLLKDLSAFYAGVRMTSGSKLRSGFVPDHDNELVIRLKRGGLVTLGKTNTPEFGILPTTEPLLFGPCRNPWNPERTVGGSSGGSSAAVASGMVPMAHANDGGGSIRGPASCCGVFGLKPTRARNPLGPDRGDVLSGLVAEHAITRSVRDSAALLDLTSGPDIGDPYWPPPRERPFLQEAGADAGRLRIGFSLEAPTGVPVHADCSGAVTEAAKLCAGMGHDVEEAKPDLDGEAMFEAFSILWATGCASALEAVAQTTGKKPSADSVEPLTWVLYETGRELKASDYMLALQQLQRMARRFARFFIDYDVWLSPTLAKPPVPLGTFDYSSEDPMRAFDRAIAFVPFTPICNVTGQPAMSVPLFWNSEGLPIGTHFAGRFGDEATLFRLAAQLEAAHPWSERRPPISA